MGQAAAQSSTVAPTVARAGAATTSATVLDCAAACSMSTKRWSKKKEAAANIYLFYINYQSERRSFVFWKKVPFHKKLSNRNSFI